MDWTNCEHKWLKIKSNTKRRYFLLFAGKLVATGFEGENENSKLHFEFSQTK